MASAMAVETSAGLSGEMVPKIKGHPPGTD